MYSISDCNYVSGSDTVHVLTYKNPLVYNTGGRSAKVLGSLNTWNYNLIKFSCCCQYKTI